MSTQGNTSVWNSLEDYGELAVPPQGDEESGEASGKREVKRRSAQGRLSRLTQPGASDLIHMWDTPQTLPDVYDMRLRGGLPDESQEVRAYLWDEMLPPLRSPQDSRRMSVADVARVRSSDGGRIHSPRLSEHASSGAVARLHTSTPTTNNQQPQRLSVTIPDNEAMTRTSWTL